MRQALTLCSHCAGVQGGGQDAPSAHILLTLCRCARRRTRCAKHSHCAHIVQVREEAGELCQTLEANEGKERAASEAADLLYHAMVLLNVQVRVLACPWWCYVCAVCRTFTLQLPCPALPCHTFNPCLCCLPYLNPSITLPLPLCHTYNPFATTWEADALQRVQDSLYGRAGSCTPGNEWADRNKNGRDLAVAHISADRTCMCQQQKASQDLCFPSCPPSLLHFPPASFFPRLDSCCPMQAHLDLCASLDTPKTGLERLDWNPRCRWWNPRCCRWFLDVQAMPA